MESNNYRKRTEWVITSTKLEDFAYCQKLYQLKWIQGVTIEDEEEEGESEALLIGSAYDLYVQSVAKFNETYAVVPKRNGATGKIELTQKQGELIRKMAAEMDRQEFYNPVGEKQFNLRATLDNGLVISGTFDEFQKGNKLIIDDKTSAGIRKFRDYRDKYFRQVSLYSFIAWLTYRELFDGMIRMVTKDKIPKAMFYFVSSADMWSQWAEILRLTDELKECIDTGRFRPSPREKCLECQAYAHCPNSVQKEIYRL